jgi:hypothetical protein
MEFGVNVDSLQNIVVREEYDNNINSNTRDKEKYTSKIVEYTFFVKNEIEISEKINNTKPPSLYYNSLYRYLTIKKYDFVKVCESNKQIVDKLNLSLELNNNVNKKIVLLKYKKNIDFCCDFDKMLPFIDSFLNNKKIFHYEHRGNIIFWNFIRHYEKLFRDFIFFRDKQMLFLDFSSKNLLYDSQDTLFLHKFEKCLIHQIYNISQNDLNEHGNLQKISKYIEIERYIDKFIKIIDSIEYYGNKHFDLYFSKQLIKHKSFYSVYQNLDNIIEDYLNNLYFLKNFSDKFKNDNKIKWKTQIKQKIEENVAFLNFTDITKLDLKLYLLMLLERYETTVWETFSLNSLFLNITYYMIKMFDVKDKTSLMYRYFKFLFKNIDVNCSSFNIFKNSNNNINMDTCMRNYDNFRYSFEHDKDFTSDQYFCLSNVTPEIQEQLYEFLSQNCIIDNF